SMTGDNPAQVTILVNAVVNAYLNTHRETEHERRTTLLNQYTRIKDDNEEFIKNRLNEIHSKKKLGAGGEGALDFTQMQALDVFRAAQTEFREATAKLRRLRQQYNYETARQGQQKKPVKKSADVPQFFIQEEMEKDEQ